MCHRRRLPGTWRLTCSDGSHWLASLFSVTRCCPARIRPTLPRLLQRLSMRTTGTLVDGGHRRRCGACRGRLRPSDVGSVAAQSCCTIGTLTLKCQRAGPVRIISLGMSVRVACDRLIRRSTAAWACPPVSVKHGHDPTHRARSGHDLLIRRVPRGSRRSFRTPAVHGKTLRVAPYRRAKLSVVARPESGHPRRGRTLSARRRALSSLGFLTRATSAPE